MLLRVASREHKLTEPTVGVNAGLVSCSRTIRLLLETPSKAHGKERTGSGGDCGSNDKGSGEGQLQKVKDEPYGQALHLRDAEHCEEKMFATCSHHGDQIIRKCWNDGRVCNSSCSQGRIHKCDVKLESMRFSTKDIAVWITSPRRMARRRCVFEVCVPIRRRRSADVLCAKDVLSLCSLKVCVVPQNRVPREGCRPHLSTIAHLRLVSKMSSLCHFCTSSFTSFSSV